MTGVDVTALLAMSEPELLDLLGGELLGTGPGVGPQDPGERRRFGETWLGGWLAEHRRSLCGSAPVVHLLSTEGTSQAEDVAALVDVLMGLLHGPVVTTVAVILVRRGLDSLCIP